MNESRGTSKGITGCLETSPHLALDNLCHILFPGNIRKLGWIVRTIVTRRRNPMKCIMHLITCSISRVTDDIARKKVDSGTYQFVSKRQWKTEVRDKVIVVP